MKLSIVIVNYNVKYFLEQCLLSVKEAIKQIDAEVYVVDNSSRDESVAMVLQKFPWVKCIANTQNIGFSKANNQAMREAQGQYILLLNPDTVVAEDSFEKCIAYMDSHNNVGGLGIKMVDGTGQFLPESKRALPTPWVSFCKIIGLSSLFPNSETFARYHLGFLDKQLNHEIDVLSGAYMFMRKEALEKCGLLDEDFFMYGEDIDLSYRIIKAGYNNHYFAESTIIHYKGESTKKGSINYVKTFYEAMMLFAKKHYSSGQASLYISIINIAIVVKAIQSMSIQLLRNSWLPIFDFCFSFLGMYLIKELWENKIMQDDAYYNPLFTYVFIPLYILVWMSCSLFAGAYDKPIRPINILKGLGVGTLILTALFGLLPNEYRYSRAIILISGVWVTLSFYLNRYLFSKISKHSLVFENNEEQKIAIVGSLDESRRVLTLLNQAGIQFYFSGFISPQETVQTPYIGSIKDIDSLIQAFKINELIFCNQDISNKDIISQMERLPMQVNFKIVPMHTESIIGSNSKNTSGDLYAIDTNLKIGSFAQQRNKRLFDIVASLILLINFPIALIYSKNLVQYLVSIISVLVGNRTWISYATSEKKSKYQLPMLKKGILDNTITPLKEEAIHLYNLQYAREYNMAEDIKILWKKRKLL
ncbi:MAG: glycosyltransferase [Bacteroidota bacterium]